MEDTMKIYVACLASYNAGKLHGAWIEVEDLEQIQDEIDAMLKASPVAGAEEWEVHDHSGWEGFPAHECSLEKLVILAELLEEFGADVVSVWVGSNGFHYISDNTAEDIQQTFVGEFDSYESIAWHVEEIALESIPFYIRNHIDFETLGREISRDGHYCERKNGSLILFRS